MDSQAPGALKERKLEVPSENNTLGMWVFLSGEVMFFGSVFTAYLIYHLKYTPAFTEASSHLNVLLGAINTALLLTSSFTMALAVHAAQSRKRTQLVAFLVATFLLGAVFLGIKGFEYSQEFGEHLFPGPGFQFAGTNAAQARLFFSLYFILTGLHAIHMLIGLFVILIMAWLSFRGYFTPKQQGALAAQAHIPVELTGLFWHFIDLVWIFIFPLLYLIHPG